MKCEACENGDHWNCGIQTWCDCDCEGYDEGGWYPVECEHGYDHCPICDEKPDEQRQSKFWDCEQPEILTWTDRDEAIEAYLSQLLPEEQPETVTVYGYAPMQPRPDHFDERVLEDLLERLDDNYGNHDGDATEPTDAMRVAARVFVTSIIDKYTPWACEVVTTETVNVREWIAENTPEWLK